MADRNPGPDPFPPVDVEAIAGFRYLDELAFDRHARVRVDKTPRSLRQLAADFRVRRTVRPKGDAPSERMAEWVETLAPGHGRDG